MRQDFDICRLDLLLDKERSEEGRQTFSHLLILFAPRLGTSASGRGIPKSPRQHWQ